MWFDTSFLLNGFHSSKLILDPLQFCFRRNEMFLPHTPFPLPLHTVPYQSAVGGDCNSHVYTQSHTNSSRFLFINLVRPHCFKHSDGVQQTNLRPGNKTSGLRYLTETSVKQKGNQDIWLPKAACVKTCFSKIVIEFCRSLNTPARSKNISSLGIFR